MLRLFHAATKEAFSFNLGHTNSIYTGTNNGVSLVVITQTLDKFGLYFHLFPTIKCKSIGRYRSDATKRIMSKVTWMQWRLHRPYASIHIYPLSILFWPSVTSMHSNFYIVLWLNYLHSIYLIRGDKYVKLHTCWVTHAGSYMGPLATSPGKKHVHVYYPQLSFQACQRPTCQGARCNKN